MFRECGCLNINVSEENENYCDINGVLFNKSKDILLAYAKDKIQPTYSIPNGVTRINNYAFYGCRDLTEITIPICVTEIANTAFINCSGLTNIKIPAGIKLISAQMFAGCYNLTEITIPDSVELIRSQAFQNCIKLTDVYYGGSEEQWNLIGISEGNEPLINATIHYNSPMPTQMPSEAPTAAPDVTPSPTPTETPVPTSEPTATPEPIKPLEVKPVEPVVNAEENRIEIPVTVVDPERAGELNEVELYVAEYDSDGRFVGLTLGTKGEIEGDTVVITADIPEAEKYKFMLWDGNNVPLMDAVEDVLE